ncbi:MAG TPA: MarR family transcriptional regulator [Pyrinomonadaceae bacterium]|jgi:MarR family 2-MHQ and catechol resistance regulon transcriptional repressor|nr:MarR family transcriptional regulator [Pyrinomonadaceae bacterium]
MRVSGSIESPAADKREQHYLERMHHHGEKYREFHRPSVELLVNLIYTYDVIYTRLAREVEREGLSVAAFNVLMILSRCGRDGCPMHELGELLLVSRANVTGLVSCLERRGLVERVASHDDRRVRLVRLTKAGARRLEKILPRHYSVVRDTLEGMSDGAKADLCKLLTRLRRATLQTSADMRRTVDR